MDLSNLKAIVLFFLKLTWQHKVKFNLLIDEMFMDLYFDDNLYCTKILKNTSRCFSRIIRLIFLYDMIDYLLSIMTTIVFDGLGDFGIIDTLDVSYRELDGTKGIESEIRYNFEGNFEIATLRG